MIIVMKKSASENNITEVVTKLEGYGLQAHLSEGKEVTIIGVIGDKSVLSNANLEILNGVDKLVPITETYKLTNKKVHPKPSLISVNNNYIGGDKFTFIAGPCSVEDEDQIFVIAEQLNKLGIKFLRGGAFKPRTSPYAFQGLGVEGLKILRCAGDKYDLSVVSEVTSLKTLEKAYDYIDVIQIGARNMHNFELLKEAGKSGKAVLLKRGLSATIDEWLNAAEYIMREGNENVVLCERGIRTFETATRNTLDISAVPVLKEKTHLPVIIDPSHASGRKNYIPSLSKAAVAAGADGLMIEIHPKPEKALSDGPQSLKINEFIELIEDIKPYIELSGKVL